MTARQSGRIINISSAVSQLLARGYLMGGQTNLIGFTRSLAKVRAVWYYRQCWYGVYSRRYDRSPDAEKCQRMLVDSIGTGR
jgi:hypothetical protein